MLKEKREKRKERKKKKCADELTRQTETRTQGLRDARCEMRDARCEMRDARCEMRDARLQSVQSSRVESLACPARSHRENAERIGP
jgi:hypothetical protein